MAIPRRVLGKTGVEVTALGLGGVCWNLLEEDAAAVAVVHHAIDRGITYIDTASGYKESERRLGLALRDRDRRGLFIATKCLKRSGAEAEQEIAESFDRLQLETIDLMQLHAIDQEQDLAAVLAPDGALRVIERYRQAGRIRFVGVTGHTHPAVLARMVQEYDFDTILNPLGAVDRVWNDFSQITVPAARSRRMGVVAMKVMAYGQVPAEDRAAYLRYAMGLPVDVAVVGMDSIDQVEANVRVAEAFAPLSPAEERDLLERSAALIPRAKKELWWLPEQRVGA